MDTTDEPMPKPQRKSLLHGDAATPGLADDDSQHWATEVLSAVPAEDEVPLGENATSAVPPPWYRKPWVWAITGGGLLVVAAGVTWSLVANGGGDDLIASPSESPSVSASASPTVSPSAEPASLLDDGISDGDYPAAAPRAGERYPEALVMEDWVWDKVGAGWAVVSIAPYGPENGTPEAMVIYLASPEGVLFEVQRTPARYVNAEVVSVLEDERKLRFSAYDTVASSYGGALMTLETGAVDHMSFSFVSGYSGSESFVSASATNAELWVSTAPDWSQDRFERWTPASGWQRANTGNDVVSWNVVSSPDGELVLLEIASNTMSRYSSARSGPDGAPHLVVYNVATDSSTVVRPDYGASDDYCSAAGISNTGEVTVSCWSPDTYDVRYFAARDRQPLTDAVNALPLSIRLVGSTTVTDASSGLTVGGTPGDSVAYEISMMRDGEEATLLKSGENLGFRGIQRPSIVDLGGGLSLVSGSNACALIDRENGAAAVLGQVQGEATFGCVLWGVGGGSTTAGGGWEGGA